MAESLQREARHGLAERMDAGADPALHGAQATIPRGHPADDGWRWTDDHSGADDD